MNRPAFALVLLLAATSSHAGNPIAEFWNSPEQLRIGFHAANGLDATTTIMRDPTCMSEANRPLLGSDPPPARVLAVAGLVSLGYELLYRHAEHAASPEARLVFGRVAFGFRMVAPILNAGTLARGCD